MVETNPSASNRILNSSSYIASIRIKFEQFQFLGYHVIFRVLLRCWPSKIAMFCALIEMWDSVHLRSDRSGQLWQLDPDSS